MKEAWWNLLPTKTRGITDRRVAGYLRFLLSKNANNKKNTHERGSKGSTPQICVGKCLPPLRFMWDNRQKFANKTYFPNLGLLVALGGGGAKMHL